MSSVLIKHMLSDYEKWKFAFELLSSSQHGVKILGYTTEMDKTNPSILITQIRLGDQDKLLFGKSTEPINKILDRIGLHKRYEIEWRENGL